MSGKPPQPVRLGVLLSGRGSNLQAIIDAIEAETLSAEIAVVVSNKQEAGGLERARKHNVAHVWLDPKPFAGRPDSRESYDRALLDVLRKYEVDLVLLAGYMKIVTAVLVSAYENRMMNIHPSLLPSFPGLDVQKKALEHGCKIAGCTVHFVTEGVDEGPIIIQAAVPIVEGESPDDLAGRILEQEHLIYPRAIQLYAERRLRVEGRRVIVADAKLPADGFHNPA